MNRSTPGLPVHHQLPEFTQSRVHRVSDAIQPSHSLSSPSPPAPSPSQHQSLLQWVNSSHDGLFAYQEISWNFLGKNPGVDCHSLLQGIFLTQGSNPSLLHCRRILYCWAPRVSAHTCVMWYLYVLETHSHGLKYFLSLVPVIVGRLLTFPTYFVICKMC